MQRPSARNFLSLLDLTTEEIDCLLDEAERLRQDFRRRATPEALRNKAVAFIWDSEGFRNRVAFELGVSIMGGVVVQVPGRLDERESVEDVAAYLNNWFDAVVVRTRDHEMLTRLVQSATVPVINARTAYNYPCDILGDLAFVHVARGGLDGIKVVFVGEATNLCHSWFEADERLPIEVNQVCPEGYGVAPDWSRRSGLSPFRPSVVTHDLDHALHDADLVYTDVWPTASSGDERRHNVQRFLPYQITSAKLALAKSDVLFLPCPPVHRGEEVSAEAMASPLCRVYEAKEYLLHAQNAVLIALLGDGR